MRKVFSTFLVAFVLLLCIAPVFSYADSDLQFYSTILHDYIYQYDCSFSAIVSDENTVYFYAFKFPSTVTFNSYYSTTASNIPFFGVRVNNNSNNVFNAYVDVINILSGAVSTYSTQFDTNRVTWGVSVITYSDEPLYFYSPTDNNTSYNPSSLILSQPFVTFAKSSDDYINAPFPKPVYDPYHAYFADSKHFYMITSDVGSCLAGNIPFMSYTAGSTEYLSTTDSFLLYDTVFPSVEQYGYNQFKFVFHNNLRDHSYTRYFFITVFDIISGSLINSYNLTIPPNNGNPYEWPFRIDEPDKGYWSLGLAQDDSMYNIPLLSIRWAETIDYSNQLNSVISLLNQLFSTEVSINTLLSSELPPINENIGHIFIMTQNIDARLADVNDKLANIITILTSNFQWFKTTFYDNLNNKWTFTNNYLVSIYNLLNETDETVKIEDDTSGVAAMESAKNDLVVTNAAGQTVDAGDAAAAGLSEAAVQIGEIAQPVSTINSLMQSIVFDKPKLLLPVIVALGLGLMVTILGKNKSD